MLVDLQAKLGRKLGKEGETGEGCRAGCGGHIGSRRRLSKTITVELKLNKK